MKIFRKFGVRKRNQSFNLHLYKTPIQFFSPMARQSLVGQGLLLVEVSRSHSDTRQSLGILWTSDRPVAKTSTRRHTILTRDNVRVLSQFRERNPRKRRQQTHAWDRAAPGISTKLIKSVNDNVKNNKAGTPSS